MSHFPALGAAPKGRLPQIRAAYRILGRAHASVTGLFDAAALLEQSRRSSNQSPVGRKATVEQDVARSAIIFTSAGLDAAMKRLVNDCAKPLIAVQGSAARAQYELYLKSELAGPKVSASFHDAIKSMAATESLIAHYLSNKTKESMQGSGDLQKRVRNLLGIKKKLVPDAVLKALDPFFEARNKISHDMDLKDPTAASMSRVHRNRDEVAAQCAGAFDVAVKLIWGAADVIKREL